jgi:hypothetical protein
MRKWLSEKLFFWAYRLDRENTLTNAQLVVEVWKDWKVVVSVIPERKPGRPKGRKDGVGPKPEPKKRGRPLGSKNKPKGQVA